MVDIDFIKTTSCPVCGCSTIVSESVETDGAAPGKIRQHCNGGRWERRKFACGFHTSYVPNYGKEETLAKCAFDPEEERKREQQEALKAAVLGKIDAGDCPDEYKDRLKQAIAYL